MNETLSYQIQEPRKFKAGQVKGKKNNIEKNHEERAEYTHTKRKYKCSKTRDF